MLFKQNAKQQNAKTHGRPIKKLNLRLKTDLDALPEVLDRFEKLALPRLPGQFYGECQLALAESFTNVVRHAHRNLPRTTPIDLEIDLFSRGLEMRIWDCGQPFDWDGQLQLKLQGDDDPFAIGGRGLFLIHQVMDEHRYIPADNGEETLQDLSLFDLAYLPRHRDRNCLVLWKQLPQRSPQKGDFVSFLKRVARKVERILRKIIRLFIRSFRHLRSSST